ncbi:peptidylprolyl isomerase PrsA [Lactiplantibacillus fabifermentans]|uniref:Foldase protein PrsA n=2 Tax=Lactiplantibacillus fabifermentans TaxID=483011 RepID=A0A0R2NSM5_9LACO|nr:peptidylprolyl isomerase PrsA [Lactiplantibacillus fabifermentans]ETY74438.1 peptidylprolyl isomerase [Lactiplantibacillus fabifermentans T30PCM01]KRO28676.1 peptidylprolyl isomerase [Lactiplantibacillus fabifermentans DSM 21115]
MKKWLIALAGVLLTFTLAGCGSKTVASTSGGKITESQYYSSMKGTSSGKQVLQQMILNKVLEKDYGSKVSSKKVTKQYNTYKSQYGSSFSTVLTQNGLTAKTFKEQIRSNLLLEQAVKDKVKITDAALKKQWKSYEPKVTVQHILVSKKATADTVLKELKKDSSESNFSKLAKKYSTDSTSKSDGGKLSAFDNTNTSYSSKFLTAAFKLKNGEYTTTAVKTSNGYEIIRMIKNPGKGKMSDHTQDLKEQIWSNDMSDSTVLHNVVSKVLKGGNVSIKDSDLKDILSSYLSTSSSSSSSSN